MFENLVLHYNAVVVLKSFNELVIIRDFNANFYNGKIFNVCEKVSLCGKFVFSRFECIVDDVEILGSYDKCKCLKVTLRCV